jgi:hypothetical protein
MLNHTCTTVLRSSQQVGWDGELTIRLDLTPFTTLGQVGPAALHLYVPADHPLAQAAVGSRVELKGA